MNPAILKEGMSDEELQRCREAIADLTATEPVRRPAPVEPWVYDMAARVNAHTAIQQRKVRGSMTFVPYDAAITLMEEAEERLAHEKRAHVVQHIVDAMRQELEAGGPPKPPSEPDQFVAVIRNLAGEIRTYGDMFLRLAEVLKAAGKGLDAGAAYKAHLHARDRAKELLGDA